MKLKSGCKVPYPDQLDEGYMVRDHQIIANVDIERIEAVMRHFIVMHQEPLFFILELPTHLQNETRRKESKIEAFHNDVYYIDGCSQQMALDILAKFGEILCNDGLSSFGYGGHESGDEIMFGKYNVLTIFSQNTKQYDALFAAHKIERKPDLLTAWQTFEAEHPGISDCITKNGTDVFSIPSQLAEWGIYLAERRET